MGLTVAVVVLALIDRDLDLFQISLFWCLFRDNYGDGTAIWRFN